VYREPLARDPIPLESTTDSMRPVYLCVTRSRLAQAVDADARTSHWGALLNLFSWLPFSLKLSQLCFPATTLPTTSISTPLNLPLSYSGGWAVAEATAPLCDHCKTVFAHAKLLLLKTVHLNSGDVSCVDCGTANIGLSSLAFIHLQFLYEVWVLVGVWVKKGSCVGNSLRLKTDELLSMSDRCKGHSETLKENRLFVLECWQFRNPCVNTKNDCSWHHYTVLLNTSLYRA